MEHFVSAVRQAIESRNWFAALAPALILPDVCGRLEDPLKRSRARYEAWWSKYVLPKYTSSHGSVMLGGSDVYALRCATLHEGSDNISQQAAQDLVKRFRFVDPDGDSIHRALMFNVLWLRVDLFCGDICSGADQWINDMKDMPAVQERIASLMTISSNQAFFGRHEAMR
jgi:hypothetical protein